VGRPSNCRTSERASGGHSLGGGQSIQIECRLTQRERRNVLDDAHVLSRNGAAAFPLARGHDRRRDYGS
jgi:hypothetical protein